VGTPYSASQLRGNGGCFKKVVYTILKVYNILRKYFQQSPAVFKTTGYTQHVVP
jgi:hypothetical protein